MFQDVDFAPLSLSSDKEPTAQGDVHSTSSQTGAVSVADREVDREAEFGETLRSDVLVQVQSALGAEVGVQTEQAERRNAATGDGRSTALASSVDMRALAAFLTSREEELTRLLCASDLALRRLEAAHSGEVASTLTHSLRHLELAEGLQGLCLDWNCLGSTVALGTGHSRHEDWCAHAGLLCTWNLDRRKLDPAKADRALELETCMTALRFHPARPALLAVGAYNGDVSVLDLALEASGDLVAANSKATEGAHKDPITDLQWLPTIGDELRLVSSAYDGNMLVWLVPTVGRELGLQKALHVSAGSLPRALRGRVTATGREAGLTSLALSRRVPELFLAAGETGAVLHCSMEARDPVNVTGLPSPANNPVIFPLTPHLGPVYSITASPFHADVFLTTCGDGKASLYHLNKLEPLVTVEEGGSLYAGSWSPARPLVFAVAGQNGSFALYDLSTSEVKAVRVEEASTGPLFAVAFCPTSAAVLATADSAGVVKIWRLGDRFVHQTPDETAALQAIADRNA